MRLPFGLVRFSDPNSDRFILRPSLVRRSHRGKFDECGLPENGIGNSRSGRKTKISRSSRTTRLQSVGLYDCGIVRAAHFRPEKCSHACSVRGFSLYGILRSDEDGPLPQNPAPLHAPQISARSRLSEKSAPQEGSPLHHHPSFVSRHFVDDQEHTSHRDCVPTHG